MADFFADEAGLVVPSTVFDSLSALVAAKSPFISSGAATVQFEDTSGMGGHFVTKRYSDEDGDHDSRITGVALTPTYLLAVSDTAPVCRRARFRRVLDGQGAAEGGRLSSDPTARILETQAEWWAKEFDLSLLSVLAGAFDESAGVLKDTHVSDISGSVTAVALSFAGVVTAGKLLGDRANDLRALVVRSEVAADLVREAGVKMDARPIGPEPFLPTSFFVGGARVVISDLLPSSGSGALTKYTSYLLGPAALWLATQQSIREFRAVVPSLPGVDLTTSWHYAPGLSGVTAASSAINPVNATLATAGTWSLSVSPMTDASRKSIAAVKIVSNAT
jgi:hypothetical protein